MFAKKLPSGKSNFILKLFDSEIHPKPCLKTCSAKTCVFICLPLSSEEQEGGRQTEGKAGVALPLSKEEHHSLLLMSLSTDFLSPLGKRKEDGGDILGNG